MKYFPSEYWPYVQIATSLTREQFPLSPKKILKKTVVSTIGWFIFSIRKGVFTSREITLPYNRIQDIYVDQNIFDRLFSLYDVHLSTATISSGIEAHIDGLEKEAANGLREILFEKIHQPLPV